MSAWWLLPLALAACLAVLAIAACLSPKPRHAAPRRHLAAVPEPVAPAVGSMILAEERLYASGAELSADLEAHGWFDPAMQERLQMPRTGAAFGAGPLWEYRAGPDWREQTAADLSPEALEDSGPGGLSSLTPGPDQAPDVRSSGAVAGSIPAIALGGSEFNPHGHPGSTPVSWLADRHDGEGEGRAFHGLNHAHTERLADTADVMDARLLAEVEAMLRAQDDDAALYLSRLRSACAQARLDLAAALA